MQSHENCQYCKPSYDDNGSLLGYYLCANHLAAECTTGCYVVGGPDSDVWQVQHCVQHGYEVSMRAIFGTDNNNIG